MGFLGKVNVVVSARGFVEQQTVCCGLSHLSTLLFSTCWKWPLLSVLFSTEISRDKSLVWTDFTAQPQLFPLSPGPGFHVAAFPVGKSCQFCGNHWLLWSLRASSRQLWYCLLAVAPRLRQMEEHFPMFRQLVAITSSSCMGLAEFCGLLWRLTGTRVCWVFNSGRCGRRMLALILIDLKLFIRVVLAKQGLSWDWCGE